MKKPRPAGVFGVGAGYLPPGYAMASWRQQLMLNRIEGAASFLDSVQVLLLAAQQCFLASQFFLGCFDRSLKV